MTKVIAVWESTEKAPAHAEVYGNEKEFFATMRGIVPDNWPDFVLAPIDDMGLNYYKHDIHYSKADMRLEML